MINQWNYNINLNPNKASGIWHTLKGDETCDMQFKKLKREGKDLMGVEVVREGDDQVRERMKGQEAMRR